MVSASRAATCGGRVDVNEEMNASFATCVQRLWDGKGQFDDLPSHILDSEGHVRAVHRGVFFCFFSTYTGRTKGPRSVQTKEKDSSSVFRIVRRFGVWWVPEGANRRTSAIAT